MVVLWFYCGSSIVLLWYYYSSAMVLVRLWFSQNYAGTWVLHHRVTHLSRTTLSAMNAPMVRSGRDKYDEWRRHVDSDLLSGEPSDSPTIVLEVRPP